MQGFRFTLEKSSKKHICPSCNKKRFVRYVDVENNNNFVNFKVGKCDRELNCGFHYSPKSYFEDNNFKNQNFIITPKLLNKPTPIKISYIELSALKNYNKRTRENNFIKFLLSLFDEVNVNNIIKEYLIGTSFNWQGATVFWQVDDDLKVRSGKVMLYDQNTGKRIKKPFNHITWIHKIEKLNNFNLSQCLFGLHLINVYPNKTIAIVESEKTAVIMSAIYEKYLWLACGSLNMINEKIFQTIYDKKIILFPDLSIKNTNGFTAFDLWKEKANTLNLKGFNIDVSEVLHGKTKLDDKKQGYDIADYFIDAIKKGEYIIPAIKVVTTIKVLKTKNQEILEHFIEKNPQVLNLIESLDLYIE